ncbi:MAG: hypothetical protein ACOC0J_00915, partial [Myxococcota bacterium]
DEQCTAPTFSLLRNLGFTAGQIDEATRGFVLAKGRAPVTVEELVEQGFLDEVPEDPLGGDFYFEGGEARSTSLHRGRLRPFRRATGGRQSRPPPLPEQPDDQ